MHRRRFHRVAHLAFTLAILCATLRAEIPRFSARTLDGEPITESSLQGKIVLVQFWTTWCPYCRRDQPIIDDLEHRFADKGLMVLAVNVGEPEDVVRAYLSESPRSSRVVLNSAVNLASRMGVRAYPFYVLLNAQGTVIGNRSGSGGEASMMQFLSRAGLSSRTKPSTVANETRDFSRDSNKPLMISVPPAQNTAPAKPHQKTIFVLTDGQRLESDDYTIDSTNVVAAIDGKKRTIALSALNLDATKAANRERGVTLAIPASHSEIVLSF